MRQLGDLLVWVAMIGAVLAVLYLTPRIQQFISDDARPSAKSPSVPEVALVRTFDAPSAAD
jgi:hypothetical protein